MTPGPADRPLLLPVPTGAEAAAFDAAARDAGIPGPVLMESAGRAAADLARTVVSTATVGGAAGIRGPIVVFAGAGNNGGDAVVLARTLHARGLDVVLLVDPRRPAPDPLLHGHSVPTFSLPTEAGDLEDRFQDPPALLVDGLLGTGLESAPREPVAGWIRSFNRLAAEDRRAGTPVLSLDLPSGVIADSGRAPGDVVRADFTVSFGAPKLGTLLHPGRAHAGRVVAVEIGFPPWPAARASAALVTGRWAHATLPRRPRNTHKNAVGRLLLICGGDSMGGAGVLAARAALRTGVGMLRVLCAPRHRDLFHNHLPEAILPDPTDVDAVWDAVRNSDAVAAGPGMGLDPNEYPARLLPAVLEGVTASARGALLLDADALTLLGRGTLPPLPRGEGDRCLLTPHPGELARILGEETVPEFPLQAARRAAERWGATCLLKGAPSVVATAGNATVRISASGGSAFARGGMGDVLTGVAGALQARGLPAADAAALALHLTGRAADRFMVGTADPHTGPGPHGARGGPALHAARGARASGDALLPSDLVVGLPAVLAEVEHPDAPDAGGPVGGEGPDLSVLAGLFLDLGAAR